MHYSGGHIELWRHWSFQRVPSSTPRPFYSCSVFTLSPYSSMASIIVPNESRGQEDDSFGFKLFVEILWWKRKSNLNFSCWRESGKNPDRLIGCRWTHWKMLFVLENDEARRRSMLSRHCKPRVETQSPSIGHILQMPQQGLLLDPLLFYSTSPENMRNSWCTRKRLLARELMQFR